jgi:peptidoglycan hydrolase-like protein with peptidoglycan-binding domain
LSRPCFRVAGFIFWTKIFSTVYAFFAPLVSVKHYLFLNKLYMTTKNLVFLTWASCVSVAAVLIFFSGITTVSAAVISGQLEEGDTGSGVSALQTFLAKDSRLYPEGLVTGFFGPLTSAAVRRYQMQFGIPAVGRVGPITLASINSNSGTGGSDDINASITKAVTVTPSTNSASISWLSNEAVFGRVMYATSWPFLYASAPVVSTPSGFNALQAVALSGLQSQTTYYFVLESIDVAGNLTYTIGNSFKTK